MDTILAVSRIFAAFDPLSPEKSRMIRPGGRQFFEDEMPPIGYKSPIPHRDHPRTGIKKTPPGKGETGWGQERR